MTFPFFGLQYHPPDGPANTAFKTFEKTLAEKYSRRYENLTEDDLRKKDDLDELFKDLDDLIPEEEDASLFVAPGTRRSNRKRPADDVPIKQEEVGDGIGHRSKRIKRACTESRTVKQEVVEQTIAGPSTQRLVALFVD